MKKLLFALTLLSGTLIFAQVSDRKYSAVLTSTCSNATTSCDTAGTTVYGQSGEVLGPQTLEANITGYGVATVTVTGSFTGATESFEFSDDGGIHWYATVCARSDSSVFDGAPTLADNTNRSWDCGIAAATRFRVRQTAISTGGPIVSMTLSSAQFEPAQTVSAIGQVATGTAITGLSPVYIGCDSSTSGTVTAGQVQAVRCTTSGIIANAVASGGGDTTALNSGALLGSNGSALQPSTINYSVATGTNVYSRQYICDKTAKLNALAATTTQIVAAVAAQKIYVCSIVISNNNASATTLKAVEGTGANCVTGQADVSALMNIGATSTAPTVVALGANAGWSTATAADALCFTSSAASSLEITISYVQHN